MARPGSDLGEAVKVEKQAGIIKVSRQLMDDSFEFDMRTRRKVGDPPPKPYRPPHESHRIDSEGGECLLCDAWDSDRLAELCPYIVVLR